MGVTDEKMSGIIRIFFWSAKNLILIENKECYESDNSDFHVKKKKTYCDIEENLWPEGRGFYVLRHICVFYLL